MGSLIVRQVDPSRLSRGPDGAKAGPGLAVRQNQTLPMRPRGLASYPKSLDCVAGSAFAGPGPVGDVLKWAAAGAKGLTCPRERANGAQPAGERSGRRPPDRSTKLCPPAGGIQREGSQQPVRNPGMRKKREGRNLLVIPDSTEVRTRLALRGPGLPLGRRGQSPRRPINRRREEPDCTYKVLP